MTLSAGQRLGPYEIVASVGAGGMGEVYRARDTRLGRDVAIKVLAAGATSDPDRRRRFEQEARAVAALSHSNIIALYDIGTHDGAPYLVSELLEGETLAETLHGGALPVGKAVEVGVQIAKGLSAAHAKHIVHRDLKPSNVFLTAEGQVKLLDFGIAKLAAPASLDDDAPTATARDATEAGTRLGTLGYMSPEQVRGLACDHRADMFAFGCVLYEMLSGQRAFKGATPADTMSAILKEDPPPLSDLRQSVSPGLQQVVDRCLEKRPEDRFSSAHDLALALSAVSTETPRAERAAATTGTGQPQADGARQRMSALARLSSSARSHRLLWLLGGLAAVVAVAVAYPAIARQRQRSWVRGQALPELVRLVETRDYWPAFLLARQIDAIVPDDPTLQKLRTRFTGKLEREFRPVGATVLARPRTGGEADWVELGEARGKPVPAPLGYSVFKVQAPGFEPREFAMSVSEFNYAELNSLAGALELARRGDVPDGMVRVENRAKGIWLGLDPWTFDFAPPDHVSDFFADIHEVTNREYKRFVDAGGYGRREYWTEPFERDGKTLSWDEAIALFRDATGRPGPATWEVGTYQQGTDDFPVTGVSWYEAAAYAAFAGKRLPSVYHWAVASTPVLGGDFVSASNFSGKLAAAGSHSADLNIWGLYDLAGNAREWCMNASGSERFALGGAADGPAYMFWNPPVTKPPLDRNPMTGFRCIKPVTSDPQDAQLDRPVAKKPAVAWDKGKGFSQEEWKSWQGLLSYAKVPLNARTEWTDDTLPTWLMEKVSFTAAYGDERVVAYVFLPRNVPPPWQAVIFWPGGYAQAVSTSQDGRNTQDLGYWDYLVKDGRAVIYPILKGTFERGGGTDILGDVSLANCIPPVKDVFRTIDYLETRADIRKDRVGYLGFSWGAQAGPMILAVENRIKAAVFLSGGYSLDRELFGFCQRSSTPIQMVNGRFDGFGEAQAPMFRGLGTPAGRKRHVVFDADHSLAGFEKDVIRVNLEWFDKYLGKVR